MLYRALTDRVFFCAPGEWTLHQCVDCGCGYLDPRPTPETIHLAYQQYFTHSGPGKVSTDSLGAPRRFRRALGNGYLNWRFGSALRPANKLGIVLAWLVPGKRRALEQKLRHLSRPAQGAQLLDVGFGSGVFLELARSAGWEVAGVDPDPVVVDATRQRGLNVRQGGIEAFADMPGEFDIITLGHVIEHLHDPRATLKEIHRLLRPGGRLWIDTPNIDSQGHERFGRHWRGLEPPRHLVLFGWSTLEGMLADEGFKVEQRIARYDVHQDMAAKSRALEAGEDPYETNLLTWRGKMTGLLVGLRTRLDYRHSEFVTLVATKAEAGSTTR